MKNKVQKIIFIIIFALSIITINKYVQANSIESINMDIYVDYNGNAQVTETWVCNTSQGTEVYRPYYNLGNSKITNLTVSEGTQKYTTLSSWNTSGTLSSKAYKCGINYITNGLEICWGMNSYGSHRYIVKYNISNFVSELTDSQMIYWQLIPYDFSDSIGSAKIKIYTDSYIEDSIDVWGYGNKGGLCYVNNGAIYMDSDGKLRTDEYMTLLAKFPMGTFYTSNKLNKNFDQYYQMAQQGVKKASSLNIMNIMKTLVILVAIFSVITTQMTLIKRLGSTSGSSNIIFDKNNTKIPKDVSYYRDIPCNGNLFLAYFVAYQYGIIKNKTDLLGAIILKWMKEGKVETDKIETGFINKKEETAIVLLNKNQNFENHREKEVYNMLYQASGDGVLEKKEFEKWCRGRYSRILDWFDDVMSDVKQDLIDKGLIIVEESTTLKIFKTKVYIAQEPLREMAMQLAGLKRYLIEYTLIKDRQAIEVEMFENYLIYAQLMGIAKQVSKEFKDLYPEMIEESHYNSFDDILFIHYCSTSGMSAASSARRAAQSYSGGGGGFSSGGGGGGSFGGGGGRRRFPLI